MGKISISITFSNENAAIVAKDVTVTNPDGADLTVSVAGNNCVVEIPAGQKAVIDDMVKEVIPPAF